MESAKLHFFGAAGNVTGSCYLLEAQGRRMLIDCGFYQERQLKDRNWAPFPFDAAGIDAVFLTHAHLDHCGLLPKLHKAGFRGRILATPATADIAGIVMLDAAKIQEEDALFKRNRHEKEGRRGPYPEKPLFTIDDAKACLPLFQHVNYETDTQVFDGISVSFHEAGHILGSSSIRVRFGGADVKTILFSGDVGRWQIPILRDPAPPSDADYVVMESTYGDRSHGDPGDINAELTRIITGTLKAGGNIVVPSFAIERTQEMLYRLNELLGARKLPRLTVFVDSPMAVKVTEVFQRHPELFDAETMALIRRGDHPCDFPGLIMCRSVEESKGINRFKGSAVIIAGSGMCTGGRIKHHLAANISGPENTIMFVGYQAVGTLGRHLLDGASEARIYGANYQVRARIEKIVGLSAHADRNELMRWLSCLQRPPTRVFITHGEPEAAGAFAQTVSREKGWKTTVPAYGEKAALA